MLLPYANHLFSPTPTRFQYMRPPPLKLLCYPSSALQTVLVNEMCNCIKDVEALNNLHSFFMNLNFDDGNKWLAVSDLGKETWQSNGKKK